MRRVGDNSVTSTNVDELMRRAIEATLPTYPHPNPRVGAVLLSPEGDVLVVAAHESPGQPHAEILALDVVGDTSGTTLVVTLEPCNHHGLTPPCTQAIIEARVARVVVGATDPDPRVSGQGIDRLKDAGVDVTVGVLQDEVVANDPGYFHQRRTGYPRVTLKLATTIDGQAGAQDGTSKWITSIEARDDAHRLRSENDVIIVGAGTVAADDPELTVRCDGYRGPQPRPVIIAGTRPLPGHRKVLNRDPIIYEAEDSRLVDPLEVIKDLGERGIVSAMIEGGPSIAASFLAAGVVDQIVWYIGAKLAAGTGIPALPGDFETMTDATGITIDRVDRVGPDLRISATICKER
jgi:diaminohydroxyphosphoribosylaminopyrimidine deaminase/5-amino-6-(5-phosphoribosylamino)uracil reductase